MEALQAEMARKRKEASEARGAATGGAKKWVKRGEVSQQRAVNYYEQEANEQDERTRKAVAPQHRNASLVSKDAEAYEDGTRAAAGGSGSNSTSTLGAVPAGTEGGGAKQSMDVTQVMHRLRALGQPVRLFDESNEERLERYHAVSSAMPSEAEVNLELQKGQTWGQTDATQIAREAVNANAHDAELLDDDEAELETSFVASTPEETIALHFKQLIKLWESELEAREPAETATQPGRVATAALQQCKRHMKPLFKQLKSRDLPLDLLAAMVEIVAFMQQREYAPSPRPPGILGGIAPAGIAPRRHLAHRLCP